MATHIDEQYYRSQIRFIQTQLEKWQKNVNSFPNLRYVPAQLVVIGEYPAKLEKALNHALKVRGQEIDAEAQLENPSEDMYDTLSALYGGMLYYQLSDALIMQVFPIGRPERKNTPPAELHLVLKRLHQTFQEELKEHQIAKEKTQEIKQLLDKWNALSEKERTTEQKALAAKTELSKINQAFSEEESILRHLARADNVRNNGIHPALFSTHQSTPKTEISEGNTVPNTNPS